MAQLDQSTVFGEDIVNPGRSILETLLHSILWGWVCVECWIEYLRLSSVTETPFWTAANLSQLATSLGTPVAIAIAYLTIMSRLSSLSMTRSISAADSVYATKLQNRASDTISEANGRSEASDTYRHGEVDLLVEQAHRDLQFEITNASDIARENESRIRRLVIEFSKGREAIDFSVKGLQDAVAASVSQLSQSTSLVESAVTETALRLTSQAERLLEDADNVLKGVGDHLKGQVFTALTDAAAGFSDQRQELADKVRAIGHDVAQSFDLSLGRALATLQEQVDRTSMQILELPSVVSEQIEVAANDLESRLQSRAIGLASTLEAGNEEVQIVLAEARQSSERHLEYLKAIVNRADSEMSSQLAALQGQLVAGIEDGSKRVGAACETVERLKGHISQFERVLASDPSTVYRDIENRLFSFESALKTQLEAATSRLSTISAMSKEHFAAESNAVLSAVERARDIADNAGDRFSIVSGQMLVKLASASKHLNSQMEQKIGTVAHDLEATVEEVVSRLNREITRQMGNIPAELETLSLRTSQALNALSLEQRQEVERTTIEIERHTNTVERRLEDFIGRSANQAERLEATIERQSISLASDIERQATSVDGAFRKASTIAIDGIGKAAREARDSMSVVVGQMTEPLTASSRALEATLAGTQSEWQKTLEAMHTRLFRSAAELHAGLDQKSKAVVLEIISAAAEQWTAMDRELRRRSDALEASVAARIEVLCAKLAQTDELVVKSVDDARTRMVAGAELAGQSVSTSIERATRSIKVSMDVSNEAVGEALAGAKVAASEHVKLVRGAVQELEENLISATTSVKDAVRTESANVQETIDKTAGEIESRLAEGQARFSVMHDEKSLEIIGRVEDFEVQSIRRIEVASQRVEEATRNAASFTANRLDNLSAAVISLLEGENDILTRNAAE